MRCHNVMEWMLARQKRKRICSPAHNDELFLSLECRMGGPRQRCCNSNLLGSHFHSLSLISEAFTCILMVEDFCEFSTLLMNSPVAYGVFGALLEYWEFA